MAVNTEVFRNELKTIIMEAQELGFVAVEVNSGNLHRRVGDYPRPDMEMRLSSNLNREKALVLLSVINFLVKNLIMTEVKANLYPCRHCNETGVCSSGNSGNSCQACVKYHELKGGKEYVGLACGTCAGLGQSEPMTERMNKRTKPILAMIIVFSVLIFTFLLAVFKNPHFTEFLAFSGTLIGGITAYYFSNVKSS